MTEAIPELFGIATEAIVENAGRLGLTWNLRLATVLTDSGVTNFAMATFDGDSEPIAMINMLGETLVSGERVYVLQVPPSGNFIMGFERTTRDTTGDQIYLYKPEDTARNSNSIATDPHLTTTLRTNRLYDMYGMVRYTCASNTPDIQIRFNGPSGTFIAWAGVGPASGNTANEGDGSWFGPGGSVPTSAVFYGTSNSGTTFPWFVDIMGSIVTSSVVSPFGLDWAQVTNTPASPVTMLGRSFLVLTDRGPA